jgi:hypothetical protein
MSSCIILRGKIFDVKKSNEKYYMKLIVGEKKNFF